MRVYLTSLGCRLNEAELETWARDFRSHGHQISNELTDSDLLVVNTCAVTAEAVKKSRKILKRAHRDNPQAKLVVSGCYSTLDPDSATAIEGVDLVIPNDQKEQLVAQTEKHLDLHTMPAESVDEDTLFRRGRQRAFIKVQDGCRYQCTFCIVTVARGTERSRPIDEIIDEINRIHQQGIQEAILTGVHLGGYGHDLNLDLGELLRQIIARTEIPRIRLSALEPWDLPDGFWELFDNPRLMPHLHLPLQSGSNEILRRMARRCKTDEFSSLTRQARDRVPGFNITTDIIVGFPGETRQHWEQTMQYVRETGFGHLHIFAYSPRSGTRAAEMDGRISRQELKQRSAELHELGKQMKRQELERQTGTVHQVLVERVEEIDDHNNQWWGGYTANFHRVRFTLPENDSNEGSIREIRVTRLADSGDYLLGELT